MKLAIVVSVLALIVVTGFAWIGYRYWRFQKTLQELQDEVRFHDSEFRRTLMKLVAGQRGKSVKWAYSALIEVQKMDLDKWCQVYIEGGSSDEVIAPAWNILRWLTLRETPCFKPLVEEIEQNGLDSGERYASLFNTNGLDRQMRNLLDRDLERFTKERFEIAYDEMKRYMELRRKLALCS